MQASPMFAYVKLMNEAFGNPEGKPADFGLVPLSPTGRNETAWGRLLKQCENIAGSAPEIRGEVRELLVAIKERDVVKTRDALCDIMVFALGAYHFLGYDADADMAAVLDGVMTRFCRDQTELDATIAKWAARGVTDVYTQGQFPRLCVKAASDQTDTVDGEHIPKGKFLKSVGYRDTVFPPAPEPTHVRDMPLPQAAPARKFFGQPRPHMAEASAPQRRKTDGEPPEDDETARMHG